MRIWSVHPKYLDSKGLLALWRETLLAKNVLEGKTTGYKNHPQLKRFKNSHDAVGAIHQYLFYVYLEAVSRGYKFDREKFQIQSEPFLNLIPVTTGQLDYERIHLLNKLKVRNLERFAILKDVNIPEINPLFAIVNGDIEEWEKTS